MKVLAFDTSGEAMSAAVWEDGKVLGSEERADFVRRSEALLPRLEGLLDRLRLKPAALGLIAVGLGPGSFTGLRVGVSAAKSLAWALGKRLVGVPSFEAIARAAGEGDVLVLRDARRGAFYAGLYRVRGGEVSAHKQPVLTTPSEALAWLRGPTRFAGEGVALCRETLAGDPRAIFAPPAGARAADIAALAAAAAEKRRFADVFRLDPLYVRPRDCNVTAPKKRGVHAR